MTFLYRPSLTPSIVDEAWFPRYDIDEEAMLEAEEVDLRNAMKLIRKANAVPHVGKKAGGNNDEGIAVTDGDTDGTASGSDTPGVDSDADL